MAQPLPALRRALLQEILRQLAIAKETIDEALASATSADASRRLTRQRAEIARAIEVFRSSVDGTLSKALDAVWSGGVSSVGDQLGVSVATRVDLRTLLAIRTFMTNRIADISAAAIKQINTALTQQLLGVRSMSETISDIEQIMDGAPRNRATTIAYTEIGRAYSAAQYETMQAQAKILPGLMKRWLPSGKAHPRPGHVLAGQQPPIPVDESFEIVNLRTGETEKLRYPRDPNASAYNTINCGCMMVAVPPSIKDIFSRPIGELVKPGTIVRNGVTSHADGILSQLAD